MRDALTSFREFATWPCDEINYIWRYGNPGFPTDELGPELATARVRAYIRRAFRRMAQRNGGARIVEKTCANALRVPYVDRIVPEALYVHIVRDGRDAAASAARRWVSSFDLGYTLRKARFVPPKDVPRYAAAHLRRRWEQRRNQNRRLPTWGPRFDGIDALAATASVPQVAVTQWLHCVRSAGDALDALPAERVLEVRYEQLVQRPERELSRLLDFTGAYPDPAHVLEVAGTFVDTSVGKWARTLSQRDREQVERIAGPQLERLGYA